MNLRTILYLIAILAIKGCGSAGTNVWRTNPQVQNEEIRPGFGGQSPAVTLYYNDRPGEANWVKAYDNPDFDPDYCATCELFTYLFGPEDPEDPDADIDPQDDDFGPGYGYGGEYESYPEYDDRFVRPTGTLDRVEKDNEEYREGLPPKLLDRRDYQVSQANSRVQKFKTNYAGKRLTKDPDFGQKIRNAIETAQSKHNQEVSDISDKVGSSYDQVDSYLTDRDSKDGKSVRIADSYYKRAKKEISARSNDSFKSQKLELAEAAGSLIESADKSFYEGDSASGNEKLELATTALDLALSSAPIIGWGKDVYEAWTGVNLVTGEKLSDFDRQMAIFGAATAGFGSKIKVLAKAYDAVKTGINSYDKSKDAKRVLEKADELYSFVKKPFFPDGEAGAIALRAKKLDHGPDKVGVSAKTRRNTPGTANFSKPLPKDPETLLRGSHGNAGLVPKEIGDKLTGKNYNNFDKMREDFWKSVGDSKYAKDFSRANRSRMKNGYAPKVAKEQTTSGPAGEVYQLHHMEPINQGGSVYDLSNIMIVTPKFHQEVLDRTYHYGN